MNFQVYDAYLERLDTLKPPVAESVYDAYSALRYFTDGGEEFSSAVSGGSADQNLLTARATVLLTGASSAHGKCVEALQKLPQGAQAVSRLESDRGSALVAYEQFGDFLADDKQAGGQKDTPAT